jgi:DNA polymerase-3 subunit delta
MLYIFHGPDDFTRKEKINELRAAMGNPSTADLNTTVLEGRDLRLSDIRHHADAMPFLADKRLVIVQGYLVQITQKADELNRLVEYLPALPPTTDLVLVEPDTLDKRHAVLKAAAQLEATVLHFGGPDEQNLRSWIMQKARRHDATIEPNAAELLGRLVGANLRTLDSELEKLALYVAGARPIQRDDVELLTPYIEESEDFGLANAIGRRDARRAYDQLHKMLDEGKHPLAILGNIAGQIRGIVEVKDMADRGMSAQEIAKSKGWNSDYPAKMRMREAAQFSMARLEAILEMLLQMDLEIKTGQIDSLLALDTLVARLCATAK